MLIDWNSTIAPDFVPKSAVAAICVGSCEQHSDYLPVGTDGMIGQSVLFGGAQKAEATVYALPTQTFGYSPHHRHFKGVITLSQQTMFCYLMDVFKSVFDQGFEKCLIVNSHGGNQSCLQTVVNELGAQYERRALLVRYWDLIAEEIESIRESEPGGMGHAGEFETSLMLHYHKDRVDETRIFEAQPAQGNLFMHPDMFARNSVYQYKPFEEYSKKGNVGQPQYGSAQKGKTIADLLEKRLAELIDWYATNSI